MSRLHRAMFGGVPAFSLAAFTQLADDDVLGVIELESNLSEVEKPPELPAGLYKGEVQSVEVKTSGAGNQYFAVKFVVPTEEIPADIAEHYEDGAILFWNRNVVPNGKDRRALFNLRKFVEALGLDTNTTTIDPNEWMGRTARLKVQMGKFNDEERAEIKAVEAADAAKPAPQKKAAAGGRRR
jgi:hypothetical protein